MGWEVRFVYEGDCRKEFEEHVAKHCPDLAPSEFEAGTPAAEARQDTYVACSLGVGAKLRGGEGMASGIEIKRRSERKKRGAELWDKEFVERAGTGTDDATVIGDVAKLLQPSDLDTARGGGGEGSAVTVSKERVQYRMPVPGAKEGSRGCKVECTMLVVLPEERVLTTIAVESKKKAAKAYAGVDKLVLEGFSAGTRWASTEPGGKKGDDWMGGAVVSYAELAVRVAEGRRARA